MAYQYRDTSFDVCSPNTRREGEYLFADFSCNTTNVRTMPGVGPEGKPRMVAEPKTTSFTFKTKTSVPKTGVLFVGWGGNNGTTVTAGILANRLGLTWRTKEGEHEADYLGSLTQSSTLRLGLDASTGEEVFVPLKNVVPMLNPDDVVIGGWDISSMPLGDAMRRAKVLDADLQRQLYEEMQRHAPWPSIYEKDFIAANQEDRADNVLGGTKAEQLERIRSDIRGFKREHGLDKVIVLWTANTERFADVRAGLNDSSANLLDSIKRGESEVSPSTVFAVASILEGCSYINGSPQNTFVPGGVELAVERGVFIGGADFKSGQTKMKSVLVDFLVSAGIKPVSIVSYNHLGNNDGKNLSAPKQFRSKEISKSNVVDDMVASNGIMFQPGEKPDHTVVIKYVPYVGDSKRAMDEYTSEIFLKGKNTIAIHNTCEDSLLAAPLIIDLFILTELFERVAVRRNAPPQEMKGDASQQGFERLHSVLSLLSFLLKAPAVPEGTPVVNALFPQRQAIVNLMRVLVGLPTENHIMLEHRLQSAGTLCPRGRPAVDRKEAAFLAGPEAPQEGTESPPTVLSA